MIVRLDLHQRVRELGVRLVVGSVEESMRRGTVKLRRPEDVAQIRGLTVSQVLPIPATADDKQPASQEPAAQEPASAETSEPEPSEPEPAEETTDGEAEDHADT